VNVVLPLSESFRALVVEVARALEPHLPDIAADWREKLHSEAGLDTRVLAAMERITFGTGVPYFIHGDFQGFRENVEYFGTRLSKLQVSSEVAGLALQAFQELSEPYISSLFGIRAQEARAALEMVSSASLATLINAYFHAKNVEAQALLATLDAELSTEDLTSMLQRVLEITAHTFSANIGAILLHDHETELMRVEATIGFEESIRGEFVVELGKGLAGLIAQSGEPLLITNVAQDTRIISNTIREKAKSLWGMPIKHEGKTIGVMVIGYPRLYEWLPTERDLMRAIADRSALAIHRARMTAQLREREAQIAELSAHLLRAQEEERKRISRELHDETGQALMVIRLYLGMLESKLSSKPAKAKVAETVQVVDRTIEGLRRIIGKLSPLVLQELGLLAAIRKEAKDLERNKALSTRVVISDSFGRLHPETEVTLYRIVQESLHNVAKHAHAKNVEICLEREGDNVRLVIEDDGVGIFPKANFRGNSFGLAGIKERVGMLDGTVRVISLKGKGTRIEISVPATEPTPERHDGADEHASLHAVASATVNGRTKLHA